MSGSARSPYEVYSEYLAKGEFRIQRCGSCSAWVFFPRSICPSCGGTDLPFEVPQGTGTVYSVTVVNRKPERGGPYNVALVELTEGVRLMSDVVGCEPTEVTIGQRVTAVVEEIDGAPAVRFRVAEKG